MSCEVLKTDIEQYCHLIDSLRYRSIHTRVVHDGRHMEAAVPMAQLLDQSKNEREGVGVLRSILPTSSFRALVDGPGSQPTDIRNHTKCVVRALGPTLAVWPPHVCNACFRTAVQDMNRIIAVPLAVINSELPPTRNYSCFCFCNFFIPDHK